MTTDAETIMRQYIQSVAQCCAVCFRQRTTACELCPASEAKVTLERVQAIKAGEVPIRAHGKRITERMVSILTQLHAPPVKSADIHAPGCTAKTKAKTLSTMIRDGLIQAQVPAAGRKTYTITRKGIKYAALHGTANP